MIRFQEDDLRRIMEPNQRQDFQPRGLQQRPEGGVFVGPMSNGYQALLDEYLKRERENAARPAAQPQPPTQNQGFQQNQNQNYQEAAARMSQSELMNNLMMLSNRIKEEQQNHEQKYSRSSEFQSQNKF